MARRVGRSRAWALAGAAVLASWTAAAAAPAAAASDSGTDAVGVAVNGASQQETQQGTQQETTAKERRAARKAAKLQPGDLKGATVVKTGWWNLVNEPPPETGLLAAPQPPAPNVPNGALPVGASLGEPQKLAAIEFALDAEPGSDVTSFRMVLRESGEPGAVMGAELAQVVACPITEIFWADGQNAAWKNRPIHDCEAGEAPGKRSDDGTWSFDLTDIAADWAAEDFTGTRSVVLVEKVDAPSSFDLSFEGPKADGVGLAVKSRPGTGEETGEDGPGGDTDAGGSGGGALPGGDTSGGTGGDLGGDLGSTGGGDLGSTGGGDLSPVDGGDVPAVDGGDEVAPETGEEATPTASGGIVPVAAPAWYSGMPRAAFLLAPVVLGLAYLMMLALGPDGRPAATTQRHGVSRALERLRQVRVRGTETA